MTDWRHDAARAVELELEHARELGEWSMLGRLAPQPEPGHYSADLRGRRIDSENLRHLCLAGPNGPPHEVAVPVDAARFTDGVLYLRVDGPVPADCDRVWTAALSPRRLLRSLADGLRGIHGSLLADRLAAGVVDDWASENRGLRDRGDPWNSADEVAHPSSQTGTEIRGSGPIAGRLTEEQQGAYRACFAPGVQLVWGPPGTGKTTVLTAAVEELIALGKRVLLVSPVAAAVDDAVVALRPRLSPGKVVRVGIAGHPDLAAARPGESDAERGAVQEELVVLDGAEEALAALDAELVGYNHEAFLAAGRRLDQTSRLQALNSELVAVEDRHVSSARELEAAQTALRAARANRAEVAGQRAHLERLADLNRELDDLSESATGRARRRWGQRKARHALEERRAQLTERIEECAAAAAPVTPADLAQLDDELTAAELALDVAAGRESELHTAVGALRRKIVLARTAGVATEQDRRFHADCRWHDLPSRHQYREILRRRMAEPGAGDRLRDRLGRLTERTLQLREEAEAAAIAEARVVATTLGTARAHEVIAHQKFDVVLVDEAAAARLAEVLLAVSRARDGAVLFGDFHQPGPVVRPPSIRGRPGVRTWLTPDVFTHCGIRGPDDAQRHPGCAVLTQQFRPGGTLRTLANHLHYRVLHSGSASRRDLGPAAEIVLVDPSTLGGAPARAGAWPLGAVLARALAAAHAGSFGVLTAQREQAVAALAAFRDGEGALAAGVGTILACHGRSYDTVLLDLLCTGSWSGTSRARQFGGAITRARRTLYLLADLDTVRSAPADSPLGVLNAVRLDQRLPVVGADSLIEAGAVTNVSSLPVRLDEAVESIWIAVGESEQTDEVLSSLVRAASRGVEVRAVLPTGQDGLESRVRDCGVSVHRADVAHPGVVVLDQHTVLLAATRPNPDNGAGEQVLVEHHGPHFAARLITDLGARPTLSRESASPGRGYLRC